MIEIPAVDRHEFIDAAAELYRKKKITVRQAADLLHLTLRETLEEFGKRGAYIRYGKEELIEDTA